MKQTINLILIPCLLLCLYPLWADSFTRTATIKIEFGSSRDQIGLDKGGGEHWKPLFFSIDKQGNIHIPDFYKNRIAVYNHAGELVRAVPCAAGLSPRMNYFTLTPAGNYITYNDYVLYHIKADGTSIWERTMGYGVIPAGIVVNEVAIFFVPASGSSHTLVFDFFSNRPVGSYGYGEDPRKVPMIMSVNKGQFTLGLEDMPGIPENTFPKKAFLIEENASFLYAAADNRSLWKSRKQGRETYYLFTADGQLLFTASLVNPQTGISGTGFWTWVDAELQIYKNWFHEDYMEIVVFRMEGELQAPAAILGNGVPDPY